MLTRLATFLVFAICAVPVAAQIDLAPQHQLGKRIVAATPFEARVYDWHCSTADLLADGGKAFLWAREGTHTVTLIAVTEDFQLRRWEQAFSVSDAPVPDPATLRDLVSDSEAKAIAGYLRALATQVSGIRDAAHFWSIWDLDNAAGFPVKGNAKLDAALKARLTPAIEKQQGLSVELQAIADEFDKPSPDPPRPTPPVVVDGKRQLLLVYDSSDSSTGIDSAIVQLRKPGTTSQSYLASGGHTLDALDSDQIRGSKWEPLVGSKINALPMLFIIDPNTNAILFGQTIPADYTAGNVIERLRENGG